MDHEAGRKTVANDLATLAALFAWCVRETHLRANPIDRVTRPRFVAKKEGMPLTRQQAGWWLKSIRKRTGPLKPGLPGWQSRPGKGVSAGEMPCRQRSRV